MKYSKKATISTVAVIVLALCGFGVYMTIKGRPQPNPVGPSVGADSITSPTAMAPTKAFSGIEGMKITYPSLWIASPASTNATNAQQKIVAFKAPNTITKTNSHGDEKVVTGAKIMMYKNSFSKSKSLDEYKNSDGFIWKYAQNKKDSVVNNIPVTEFDAAYEGESQHYAVFYKDSYEYMLVMDGEAHQKEEYKKVFDNMIKNMEFNKSP